MPPIMQVFIAVVIISAIVGVLAQVLSKVNMPNNPPDRRGGDRNRGGGKPSTDIERFLAEIDRLRQRSEVPMAQPVNRGGGRPPRARPLAEPVRPPAGAGSPPSPSPGLEILPLVTPVMPPGASSAPSLAERPSPPEEPIRPRPEDSSAPFASLDSSSLMKSGESLAPAVESTAAPVVPVTPRALPRRPRPAPKTEFAAQLAQMLSTRQGLPLAVVLTELLGPPRARRI